MKVKLHRDSYVRLESIALTDIIFCIFIFFFISFSLVYTFNPTRESKIDIKLPKADVKAPPDQAKVITVTINSKNEIYLNNKPKTLKDLKSELQSLVAFNKDRPVIIRADKSVVFDRVIQVLDVTKSAGIERLGLAIEQKPAPSPPTKPK